MIAITKEQDVESYLRKWAVIDGRGNMDGSFVPLSVAMIACKEAMEGRLELKDPSWIRESSDG